MRVTLHDKKHAVHFGISASALFYLRDMVERGKSKEGPDVAAYLVKAGHLDEVDGAFVLTASGAAVVDGALARGWKP